MNLSLTQLTEHCQARLETSFTTYIKNSPSPAPSLIRAMDYSLSNGGKRIRPLLVYATGLTLGAEWESLDAPAAAVELIHTYSLIHDDLPAMDNADLRRGKPSCHKAFDEALAILAGDALQPLAFEILATHPCNLTAEQRLMMIKTLAHASGTNGMAAGQVIDLQGVNSIDALTELYRYKTGALFSASVLLGMLASSSTTPATERALTHFADCLGLAFQIQDDLLDTEGHSTITGKPQGLDAINKKVTYPTLESREKTQNQLLDLYADALSSIAFLGEKADILRSLADYLLQRKK